MIVCVCLWRKCHITILSVSGFIVVERSGAKDLLGVKRIVLWELSTVHFKFLDLLDGLSTKDADTLAVAAYYKSVDSMRHRKVALGQKEATSKKGGAGLKEKELPRSQGPGNPGNAKCRRGRGTAHARKGSRERAFAPKGRRGGLAETKKRAGRGLAETGRGGTGFAETGRGARGLAQTRRGGRGLAQTGTSGGRGVGFAEKERGGRRFAKTRRRGGRGFAPRKRRGGRGFAPRKRRGGRGFAPRKRRGGRGFAQTG